MTDRQTVYPGAIPLDTDILSAQRNTMIALGYLAQATLGTSTVVDGLACTQTTVASMTVNVGPGSLFALQTIDATAWGSLTSDADPLVKIATNPYGLTAFTLTAPGTSGQSINYLIEAAFQESDATPVVLPYYNSANPAVAYSGPSNSGAAQNTQRLQRVNLLLKTGAAASTGSQVTPTPDSGFAGLWVVTVGYAQTQVLNANISVYPGAPFISPKLPGVAGAIAAATGALTAAAIKAALGFTPLASPLTYAEVIAALGFTPAASGRSVAPASAISATGVAIGASYNGSQTVSFTAPCAGYLVAMAKINYGTTAAANISGTLYLNGVSVSMDAEIVSQSHTGIASLAAGATATATINVVTSTSPGIGVTYGVTCFFVAYP